MTVKEMARKYMRSFHRVTECSRDKEVSYIRGANDVLDIFDRLFSEFMLDCTQDDTDTHILHFIDVYRNKFKELRGEKS